MNCKANLKTYPGIFVYLIYHNVLMWNQIQFEVIKMFIMDIGIYIAKIGLHLKITSVFYEISTLC